MPVRSINLKMLLDRGAEGEPARQKLWTTHERINSAVQQVEHYLLLMRGERYRIDDDEFKSRENVQKISPESCPRDTEAEREGERRR